MLKRARQPAHDLESAGLPDANGPFVGRDDEVELHGAEAQGDGTLQGVLAHRAAEAASTCARRNDVAAVRHVSTAAVLVGFQEVRADDSAGVVRYIDRMPWLEPVGKRVLAL